VGKIDKKNIEDILSLTPMQEGMLFHYLKEPESDLYFEQLSLEISGEIEPGLFESAWNFVIETNEMLRTLFRWEHVEKPIQIILKRYHLQPKYFDLQGKETSEKKKQLEKIKSEDKKKRFHLREVPLRVTLCKLEKTKYVMIISNHHILYDGWSNGIILNEFFKTYDDLSNGRELVKPGKTKFEEFIRWIQNQAVDKQEKYWKGYLKNFDTPTELSIKSKTGTGITTTIIGIFRSGFPGDLKQKIEDFVKIRKITVASFLYSAWGILIQKYNNCHDVIFGTTVSGRSAKVKGIENVVGLFINTLPMRMQTNSNEKIDKILYRIHKKLQRREEYETTSLANIKEWSEIETKDELFDSIVILENYPLDSRLKLGNHKLSIVSYDMVEAAHYDLTVGITLFNHIELNIAYNKEIMDESTVERIAVHFRCIVENLTKEPTKELKRASEIEILTEQERQQILSEFNDTETGYPADKVIHQLFEEQMERTPDRIAVVGPGPGHQAVTYKQLRDTTNQLACLLQKKGVKPNTITAIMIERSVEMIIGILGILKAGGAYMPIDPDYPEERIDYMLKDSSARILLNCNSMEPGKSEIRISKSETNPNDQNLNSQNKGSTPIVLNFKHLNFEFVSNFEFRISDLNASNSAYVLYTSGSTGKPKGTIVEHRPVVNILLALSGQYPCLGKDTYLLKTTYTFDVSVSELFGWFLGGGRLAILEPGGEKDPLTILDWIEGIGVTHINFVPSMFNAFVNGLNPQNISKLVHLKYIFLAGEALLPELVAKFRRLNTTVVLENIYGPTEGTVYSSKYSLSDWNGRESIPIGKPLPNIKLFILDKANHLQPVGVPGELFISGVGLARGYLNRPGLTAERFGLRRPGGALFGKNRPRETSGLPLQKLLIEKVTDKNFNNKKLLRGVQGGGFLEKSPPGRRRQKKYRTGDLTRWLVDGNIEFLGRIDHQVKLRGLRIELGEIENYLIKHAQIKEALVLAKEDAGGDKYLVAYVVYGSDLAISSEDINQLKEYLQKFLPQYMIPTYFIQVSQIPRGSTGKVDRRALPEPEIMTAETYTAPRHELEQTLTDIWMDVLSHPSHIPIGIDANFFQLGGHSLKATALALKIHRVFKVKLPLDEIFKRPTIRRLSEYITGTGQYRYASIETVEKKEYYPASSAQKRLYFLHRMDEGAAAYNMPSAWRVEGVIDMDKLENTFNKLIQRHESLRTSLHMINEEPVQRTHDKVEFKIEYYDMKESEVEVKVDDYEGTGGLAPLPIAPLPSEPAADLISSFIRPYRKHRCCGWD
jgi:amino acid adenylation domain-containing protein